MPVEISLPVHVRVGDTEARWGSVSAPVTDGKVDEAALRHALADFLRTAATCLETLDPDGEEST